jgi:ElaB/YqjD/DUF883 family membrane-anchored ribosome-binding protein
MTVKDTVNDNPERETSYVGDTVAAANDKLQAAAGQLREAADAAREKVAGAYEAAKEKTGAAYEGARSYAATTAEATRERASAAYSTARETAATVRTRTADGIEENPVVAVIGGVAIGALLGALLPRTQKETEVLAPLGDKLATLARDALAAAKDAGQDRLDELGINKDAARDQVNRLLDGAGKVVSSAGSAAAEAIREPRS